MLEVKIAFDDISEADSIYLALYECIKEYEDVQVIRSHDSPYLYAIKFLLYLDGSKVYALDELHYNAYMMSKKVANESLISVTLYQTRTDRGYTDKAYNLPQE